MGRGSQEAGLIRTLTVENESMARSLVEVNRQQEVLDARYESLKEEVARLRASKADLEEQLLKALQARPNGGRSAAEELFPFDKTTRKEDIKAIEGLPLTPVQAEVAIELFHEFSGNSSRMSPEQFARALIFTFSLSFVSTELRHDPDVTHALRSAVYGSAYGLCKGIALQGPIFTRSFQYFDARGEGALDLASFCGGLAKMAAGEVEEWGSYVFHVMDRLNGGTVGRDEVHQALHEFTHLFAHLSINVMHIIRPHLVRAGASPEAIEAHLTKLEAESKGGELAVEAATTDIFRALGTDGRSILRQEWVAGQSRLPSLVGKFRFLCLAVMHRHNPSLFEVSDFRDQGSSSPVRSPEDTSLARLHFPLVASSPAVRQYRSELSMFSREQRGLG